MILEERTELEIDISVLSASEWWLKPWLWVGSLMRVLNNFVIHPTNIC